MCRSILSIQKEQWEWRLEVTGKWGKGFDKIWKMRVGNVGGLHKIGELVLLCQLFEETLKISHPSHYKTNRPPFLASLPFPVKIFHPPITAIFQKSHPPRGVQTRYVYNHVPIVLCFHQIRRLYLKCTSLHAFEKTSEKNGLKWDRPLL